MNILISYPISEDNFIRRLLMTRSKVSSSDGSVSKGGAEIISSFQSLALNVLSLLLTTQTIACSYMDLVPSLAHWIGELEADNQSAWIDAVQCLLYIFETVSFRVACCFRLFPSSPQH